MMEQNTEKNYYIYTNIYFFDARSLETSKHLMNNTGFYKLVNYTR